MFVHSVEVVLFCDSDKLFGRGDNANLLAEVDVTRIVPSVGEETDGSPAFVWSIAYEDNILFIPDGFVQFVGSSLEERNLTELYTFPADWVFTYVILCLYAYHSLFAF